MKYGVALREKKTVGERFFPRIEGGGVRFLRRSRFWETNGSWEGRSKKKLFKWP